MELPMCPDRGESLRVRGKRRRRPAASLRSFICTNSTRVRLIAALLVLLFTVAPVGAVASPSLTAVNEYGSLSLERHKGATVDERGRGSGTFNCSVYIQLTLSGTLVTAKYSAYPRGGSIIGTATAHIHSATTKSAYFSGTITLDSGTGS